MQQSMGLKVNLCSSNRILENSDMAESLFEALSIVKWPT